MGRKKITDYWAAGGFRQKYTQDLTIEFTGNEIKIRVDNLHTYNPGGKPWSANKFFIDRDGHLKGNFKKFYADMETKFINIVQEIIAAQM